MKDFEVRIGTALTATIIVHDSTDSIDFKTAERIAHEAAYRPIYWSDDRLCHWMFDFKCEGHWCAALFHNNGLDDELDEFNPLHIKVLD
jgi:hypothetical protein